MKILYPLIIIFITACASDTPEASKPSYSSQTEMEFKKLEGYQITSNAKTNRTLHEKSIKKNEIVITTSKDGNEESIAELNQNLAFYCMKGTHQKRFKNELDCQEFVKSSLNQCEQKTKRANKSLIACVKNKLNIK